MIVIPMAGESRRFRIAGYPVSKFRLPLQDKPLFDWSVLSFAAYFDSETFLFIARNDAEVERFLNERIDALGITRHLIALLDAPTSGQAETVELGLEKAGAGDDEPLAIFNIDTIRPGIRLDGAPGEDGYLEVFQAPGDNWSFVEPAAPGSHLVGRCTEKLRISDLCCTGLYGFGRAHLFADALRRERQKPTAPELYVAPLYNHLIADGRRIGWFETEAEKVLLSGVPDEYEGLKSIDLVQKFGSDMP